MNKPFEKFISKANKVDGMLSRAELARFFYAEQIIRLSDQYGGIWNPGASWTLGLESRSSPVRGAIYGI
jgi:hypothetical protein